MTFYSMLHANCCLKLIYNNLKAFSCNDIISLQLDVCFKNYSYG
jgi:hypothetical protein